MKRTIISLCWLSALIALIALSAFNHQPIPAKAGGLPCFICHGDMLQGTDLAPRLAGTQLTDDEILKQLHKPRGVMPAFDYNKELDNTVISFIRSMPTGQPTAALSSQQRSIALATISAVAAARATEYARVGYLATPTSSQLEATNTDTSPAMSISSSSLLGFFILISGLLCGVVGMVWLARRRA